MLSLLSMIAFSYNVQASEPPTVITVSETVIVYVAPAKRERTCETRELVQGSGTVKVCQ